MASSSVSAPPPPPWRLRGPAVVVPATLPLAAARTLLPDGVRALPLAGGRMPVALALGDYREGSTLRYGELAALVGPVAARGRPGGWVTAMVVDDPRSVRGGREIWALPKHLAQFEWESAGGETRCTVRGAAGEVLASLRWRTPRRRLPLPVRSHVLGALDGKPLRRAPMTGRTTWGVTTVDVDVPQASPFAAIRVHGRRRAVAGDVDLSVGVPRLLDRI